MQRIHIDHNGVEALASVNCDKDMGHLYEVRGPGTAPDDAAAFVTRIEFQRGAVLEFGVNGITSEALLAILIHRTRALNERFACRENDIAVTKMEEALMWFEQRTKARLARGVEGREKA